MSAVDDALAELKKAEDLLAAAKAVDAAALPKADVGTTADEPVSTPAAVATVHVSALATVDVATLSTTEVPALEVSDASYGDKLLHVDSTHLGPTVISGK